MTRSLDTPTSPEEGDAAPPPERGHAIGRFLVLGSLGAGGMGVVLSAHDPDLDRRVAIKLLRGDVWRGDRATAGREVLFREAQAMARFSHPNVVAVYEVGSADVGEYVVMEQVEGRTLRAWLDEKPRAWREILDMMIQAGSGLSAAHRAGLVHRDFKPENVLVGDDGRPRVSDFGLALAELPRAGTRAYMAPEQAAGEVVDARADQYAFCVTSREALDGERPKGRPARLRNGPAWLRRALERGLAERPEDRWPSMDALLAALSPRRHRRIVGAAAAAMVISGVGAFVLGLQAAAPDACPAASIASIWDDAARNRTQEAFRKTGRPYAADTFTRVDASLGKIVDDWARAHRDACEATHVRHEQSEAMLDLRMRCLGRAKAEVSALVSLLGESDAETLDHAAQATARAGDVPACADVASLEAGAPIPRDPAMAREAEDLRQDVAGLTALGSLGKWKEGVVAGLGLIARARRGGHAPTLARALRSTAPFALNLDETDVAIDMLYEAMRVAADARDDETLAAALNSLVFAFGIAKENFDLAELTSRMAAAAVARAGNPPRLLANLYDERAGVLAKKGEYAAALPLRIIVFALKVRLYGLEDYDVLQTLGKIGGLMRQLGHPAEARPLHERAVALAEKALGSEHPVVGKLLNDLGLDFTDMLDWDGAAPILERALALTEHGLGPDHTFMAFRAHNLAMVRIGQRRLPEARSLLERAIRIRVTKQGPDHPLIGGHYEILGLVAQLEGNLDEAHRLLAAAIANRVKAYGRAHPSVSEGHRLHADILLGLGRLPEARAAAEEALAILKKTIGEEHPDFGTTLWGLGDVLRAERRPAEALRANTRSVALLERAFGAENPNLIEPLVGTCEAHLDSGDARAAHAAAERAVALATKAPPDVEGKARFCLVRAMWALGNARPEALGIARALRTKLGALPYAAKETARIDRWLAMVTR